MPKKLTTEEFIDKAKLVHGDKYDYSKVEYVNAHTKICIICKEHGEFHKTPNAHLNGQGCQRCSVGIIPTTEEFIEKCKLIYNDVFTYEKTKYVNSNTDVIITCPIHGNFRIRPLNFLSGRGCKFCNWSNATRFIEKAKLVHGEKYDYSKIEYVNNRTKVCIICKEHGEFWQKPNEHLCGKGCEKCVKKLRVKESTMNFIEKAILVHGDKYDYSKVECLDTHVKVCIICPKHGEFWQAQCNHLNGQNCMLCSHDKQRLTTDEFILKASEKHDNFYSYDKTDYEHSLKKVCITCPIHGDFWQIPNVHLRGGGCPRCSNKNRTTEDFISECIEIHGHKYDYSKVVYVNCRKKICIICPIHGEFYQTSNEHLKGHGCPNCNFSKLEREIGLFLTKKEVEFEVQKRFEWLGMQSLDFFLPQYNTAIECQGGQHFNDKHYFNKKGDIVNTLKRDQRKKKLCEKNGVNLFYYSNLGIDYPYEVFEDKELLLNEILNKHECKTN